MSTRVETEDIQTTKSETLLAAVLTAFLLIGGIWAYAKIDDAVRTTTPGSYSYRGTPAERAAIQSRTQAQVRLAREQRAVSATREQLVLRREAYRTALEAHRPEATRLGREYDRAQARFSQAQKAAAAAAVEVRRSSPAANQAEEHIAQVQQGREDERELLAFLLRLAFVLASIGAAYWLLARLRNRRSRYYALAMAAVAYAAILALFMAGDYLTDYFDPISLGPLVLSLVGIAATVLAFIGLQRYLARRVPHRRVRKGDCPFCGYPVRGSHCEGCGREVIAACAKCNEPRRVGSAHCAACGAS